LFTKLSFLTFVTSVFSAHGIAPFINGLHLKINKTLAKSVDFAKEIAKIDNFIRNASE
jgi:hypothetical protein